MTTWTTSTPIRHPWFTQPTTKRKHSTSPSPVGNPCPRSPSPSHSPPPAKRRKFSALEAGFAHLTLNNLRRSHSASPPLPHVSELFCNELHSAMSTEFSVSHHAVLPTCVEEPPAPEVKMKAPSWYEPEPDRPGIIITDLDSSSDDEDGEVDPNTATLSIPRALLKQLSTRSRELTEPQIPRNPSQALVLFRPLIKQTDTQIPQDGRAMTDVIDVVRNVRGDDAMDVEPW